MKSPYYHDIGGDPCGDAVDTSDRPRKFWELQFEVLRLLCDTPQQPLVSLHELRRTYESYGKERYESLDFYERRLEAMIQILEEKGVLSRQEVVDRAQAMRREAGES